MTDDFSPGVCENCGSFETHIEMAEIKKSDQWMQLSCDNCGCLYDVVFEVKQKEVIEVND